MGRINNLIAVYNGFGTMLEAGIPLLRVVESHREMHRGTTGRILMRMSEALGQGHTLSETMADHPAVFAHFDRTLVAAAEESGNLDKCFGMLAQWYEFIRRLKRIVLAGLMLPLLVLHVAAFVLVAPPLVLGQIGLLGYLLKVFSMLAFFYIPAMGILLVVMLGPRITPLRMVLDHLILWVPVLGKGVRELCIARFTRAFSMLFKAGLPISDCFASAPRVVGNRSVAQMFAGGGECVARGEMPSAGFSRKIPAEYRELWKVGEETGQMEECADKIAEISSDRASLLLQEFARWLPRLVYFGVALFMVRSILSLASGVINQYSAF